MPKASSLTAVETIAPLLSMGMGAPATSVRAKMPKASSALFAVMPPLFVMAMGFAAPSTRAKMPKATSGPLAVKSPLFVISMALPGA